MNKYIIQLTTTFALAVTLCACGGGGGGGGGGSDTTSGSSASETSPTVVTAKPSTVQTVIQDIVPTGSPLALTSSDYFPSSHGDTWTYDRTESNQTIANATTRTVSVIDTGQFAMLETKSGASDIRTLYKRSALGNSISADQILGTKASASAKSIVGSFVEYPEPFYPVGGERKLIRQGDWGSDLDNDGINDGFRLEYVQVLNGIELLNTKLGTLRTIHFTTTLTLTFIPTDRHYVGATLTATENTWWVAGIGLVQATREKYSSNGSVPFTSYTLNISSARVNGQDITDSFGLDGSVKKIALSHNALIYDKFRNRYLATIPGSVPVYGNSIAMIDPVTGNVSYTSGIGSDPSAMAISNDGDYVFVALRGTGEVLKYRMADMQLMWTVRLPTDPFFGQTFAESLAASPIDSDSVAVSTMAAGISPKHRGVVLIRAASVQTRKTQVHTGSNLIAFDGSGQYVFGYNNESTEYGLRRIEVLADGLSEQQVERTSGLFGTNNLYWTPSGIWLGASRYRSSDLSLLGQVNGGWGCVPLNNSSKVVCLNSDWSARPLNLVTADATSFVVAANPVFATSSTLGNPSQIVPGPTGQVAMHFDPVYTPSFSYPSILLFTSEKFK